MVCIFINWNNYHKVYQGSHKNLRKKFHDFSMTSSGQISRQKIPIFVFAALYQLVESITDRHSHTQTHIWFDQGQSTIQLILLVIELIQEVKKKILSYQNLKNDFSFPYTLFLILSLSYFNVRESILMQLT